MKGDSMSNSKLVSYTKLSPNNSGRRTHSIDRITPHCVVGQLSVETLGSLFARSSYNASCNYAIGSDGRVALIVDEGQRSWCSSSNANDQRAVTIECASDKTSPYAFNSTVYNKLIDLCEDICRRNGKTRLLWINDKNKALAYEPKSGEMLLTVHRWFANKSCPGNWMMNHMDDLAAKVTARLGGSAATVQADTSLSRGDSGAGVEEMQKMLIACGYSCGSWGADGDWGDATETAVLAFQRDHGLSVDGVYGPKTKAALTAAYGAKNGPHYYRVRKTWADSKSQVGAYGLYGNARNKADELGSAYAVFDWNGKEVYRPGSGASAGASAAVGATPQVPYTQAFINEIAPLAQADMAKTGILAAVTIAQAILESGWGRSDLAKNAHNLFGMKKNLSGNTWPGSTWDGKRVCTKDTKEVYSTGTATVSAEFRVYNNYAESVGDHSAYLAGAKNGSSLRYPGLVGCTDYRRAAQIIKDGKYATAPDYVDKICRIVEQYGLAKYNVAKTAAADPAKPAPAQAQKAKEIHVFYPGYTRRYSPDDRQGAGCVWHDQDGHTLVIDAYEKNSPAAGKLIQYLVDNGLTKIDFVGTHAHCDHLGGGFKMFEDDRITVENAYVYGPNTLKLAGDGTENGESVQEDKEYLQKFIDTAKRHGANVHIVDNGSAITCGEMSFEVYRDQPTAWSEHDTGEGWAYVNDGSLCLYSRQAYYMMSGDADASGMVQEYSLTVNGCEVGHHGNNGNRTSARIYVAHGCIWAVQCNNEAGQPGSCGFTQYGSGRMREAGVKVWQLNANIYGVIKSGKAVFTQGNTVIAWDCPFGKGDGGENPAVPHYYRVRKTWADSKSQKGAYSIYDNAKAKADEMGSAYAVFDWNGKEVYRPGKAAPTPAPAPAPEPAKPDVPFLVKVKTGMNIRKGPGTNYPAYRDCPIGVFTIVEVSPDGDWGRLKAGGWLYIANSRWVERK